LRRFEFLRNFDPLLIGLNRSAICVFRLVCDEPDFRLTNDHMGRVCGSYGAHVLSLLEIIRRFTQGVVHGFLRVSVNVVTAVQESGIDAVDRSSTGT
jgi:hypothetical protein